MTRQATIGQRILGAAVALLTAALLLARPAWADSVGQVQTTKYFAPETVQMLLNRYQAGGAGFQTGDTVSYIIQFTPIANGGSTIGAGGYITDYIPSGTEVIGAWFVQPDGLGGFTQTAPPAPAQMADGFGVGLAGAYSAAWTTDPYTIATCTTAGLTLATCTGNLAQMTADTGIFYSTDPRTTVYSSPSTDGRVRQWGATTGGNGYYVNSTRNAQLVPLMGGTLGTTLPSTHNFWDAAMTNAFGTNVLPANSPNSGIAKIDNNGAGPTPFNAGSAVAGPDTGYKLDYTGSVGPWQRIAYTGSMVGSNAYVVNTNPAKIAGTPTVLATPTSLGWNLSSSNPLPSNTNAVRWAAGRLVVGTMNYVKVSLRLTAPPPSTGIINNSEVFGGDASPESPVGTGNRDSTWVYHVPSVADNVSNLMVLKEIIGVCSNAVLATAATCVPTTSATGGAVIPTGYVKLRYRITYMNSSNGTQSNVQLSDVLPFSTAPAVQALRAGNLYVASGPEIRPTSPVLSQNPAAAGAARGADAALTALATPAVQNTANFLPIASIAGGGGGAVEIDVLVGAGAAAALAAGAVVSNKAVLTSTQLPTPGVSSIVSSTVTNTAYLSMSKTVTPSTSAPGGTVGYTLTLTNNGNATASAMVIDDFLPTAGGTLATQRFNFVVGSSVVTVNGTPLAVTPVVTQPSVTAPYIGQNRAQVRWTLTGATLAVGQSVVITFNATVGTDIPASTTAYTNDAKVTFNNGVSANTINILTAAAPVIVDVPLQITKSIDCLYDAAGTTCNAFPPGNTVPTNAKIRYKLHYVNTGGTAQTNVLICDQLASTQTTPALAATITTPPAIAPTPAGPYTNTAAPDGPPVGALSNPAVAGCGFAATGVRFSYPAIPSLAVGASGDVYYDMATNAVNGFTLTNTAKLVSTEAPGGVMSQLMTSIRDDAKLEITKTTSTPTIAVDGTATYTITVTNTGNLNATSIKIYDWLPYTGVVANANTRFNFTVGSTVFALQNGGTSTLLAPPAPVTTIGAANITPYNSHLNQQQVLWTFTPAQTLAPGASFTLTFTASAGAAGGIPAGSTIYTNDVQGTYVSGTSTLYGGVLNTAPVTIPSYLSISKTIDCIYNNAGTVCNAYDGSGLIPTNAKLRYKIHYANTSTTTAQSNVYICDQLPTQIAGFAAVTTPTIAPTPAGAYLDSPALGARTNPANAACGLAGTNFSYPVIASLAAGAAGDVYFDVQTNAAAAAAVSNTGKIVSTYAPSGESSVASAIARDLPNLQLSKTTSTPNVAAGGTASYTLSISNIGNAATTTLKVYDFLPFDGTTALANKRFSLVGGSSIYTGNGVTTPTITTSVPPTLTPYSSSPNQEQVLWDFGAFALAAGATLTVSFDATTGAAMSAGTYGNSLAASFDSANGAGSESINNQAAVTISVGNNVSGQVFADSNHNGIIDSGESWAGAPTVYAKLFAASCPATGTAISVQTLSAPGGAYSFSGVSTGNYCIVLSNNATATDTAASVPATWLNVAPVAGVLNLTMAGVDVPNQNFALFNGSKLSGRVFADIGGGGGTANDGIQNGSEAGISGVALRANNAGCASTLCDSTSSDASGNYTLWIAAVASGTVTLSETNLAGYSSTGGQAGNTGGAYVLASDTTSFTFVSGTLYSGVNFADAPVNQFFTDGAQSALPGSAVFYTHSFIAGNSGNVSFSTSAIPNPAAPVWSEVLYRDSNCNAALDAGEPLQSAPVAVTAGQTVCIILKQFVPASAPFNAQNQVIVSAQMGTSIYTHTDLTTVGQPTGAGLRLIKTADLSTAQPGQDITYTVAYTNLSSGELSNVVINDMTPAYTLFQSASCGVLPLNLTLCTTSLPALNGIGAIQYSFTGTLAPGAGGAVSFVVKVQP